MIRAILVRHSARCRGCGHKVVRWRSGAGYVRTTSATRRRRSGRIHLALLITAKECGGLLRRCCSRRPQGTRFLDGGFASHANLDTAKARGVSDMAFHKKCGLRIEDMVRSRWVYRKLRNFRAGIEAGISCLKRAYGLRRCTWRGLDHFKAYVWSSVAAYNLALFTRLRTALRRSIARRSAANRRPQEHQPCSKLPAGRHSLTVAPVAPPVYPRNAAH